MKIFMAFILIFSVYSHANAYKVPDTGQIKCYNNTQEIICPSRGQPFFGQDANYSNNQISFADGQSGCAIDTNTGLMWRKNFAGQMSFDSAYSACHEIAISAPGIGLTFRLPNLFELFSVVDLNESTGIANGFNLPPAGNVTSDTIQGCCGSPNGNAVNFSTNELGSTNGYDSYSLCVEGSQLTKGPYVKTKSKTVIDVSTGLEWIQADYNWTYDWGASLEKCNNLNVGGHTDWRLPNIKELLSIFDQSLTPPINTIFIDSPGQISQPGFFSSTTYPANHGLAYAVQMTGLGGFEVWKTERKGVMCVRTSDISLDLITQKKVVVVPLFQ